MRVSLTNGSNRIQWKAAFVRLSLPYYFKAVPSSSCRFVQVNIVEGTLLKDLYTSCLGSETEQPGSRIKVKLADFVLSIKDTEERPPGFRGLTPLYAAPEEWPTDVLTEEKEEEKASKALDDFMDFLYEGVLMYSPVDRLTAYQLLRHLFMSHADNCQGLPQLVQWALLFMMSYVRIHQIEKINVVGSNHRSFRDTGYCTNSDMTIRPSNSSKKLTRPASAPCVRFPDYEVTAEEFDPRDLTLDLSEFDDQPSEELMRLQDASSFLNNSANSDWFLNPIHRMKSPPVNLDRLSETDPLKASILKSTAQGNITSELSKDIRKTPVNSFDMSIFRNAEEEMLYSRTLSGLSTPYREELARLKVERLKIEEERMLKQKCMDELERIRGPKPRWYELKTPDFHQEARKNNDILSLSGHYNEILAYRNKLLDTLGEEKYPSRQELMHNFYHTKSHNQTL